MAAGRAERGRRDTIGCNVTLSEIGCEVIVVTVNVCPSL